MTNNRLRIAALAAILSVFTSSCNKEKVNLQADTARQIVGYYNLTNVTWEGNAVDVNGDGISSNELYPQLSLLPLNAQRTDKAHVMNLSLDMSEGSVRLDLPVQGYSVSLNGQYPEDWIMGGSLTLSLSYEINSNGNIHVEQFDSFGLDRYDRRTEMSRIKNGDVTFDFDGHLCFKVGYTVYDFRTHELVDGIIQYTYLRTNQ